MCCMHPSTTLTVQIGISRFVISSQFMNLSEMIAMMFLQAPALQHNASGFLKFLLNQALVR